MYPGVVIPPNVLEALDQSDRKIEYIEHDLKHSRVRRGADGEIISVTPPREDSLDRLLALDKQFAGAFPSPEEILIADAEADLLRHCLDKLEPEELALIRALYFDGLTERKYAEAIGLSKTALHARKCKALDKLKKKFINF